MAGGPDIGGGGLKFDTVSVLYANLLFIVLSLLPFHFRERSWYRRILFWYYAVINSLLIVAVNLADCVYFRYTQKRFTADEIFFADNSNSVQLVLKFAAENWYLLLVGAVLIWLLVWGYGRKITPRSPLREGWVYHSVNTGLLVIAILLGIAGMRGGVTRMTRPITLSNATLYASTSEKANLILSNPFCILRTIGSGGSVKYTRYFSPEKLDEYFTPTHRPDSSAVNLEGRNVMVSFWKACQPNIRPTSNPNCTATARNRAIRRSSTRSCGKASVSDRCTPTAPARSRPCPPYWAASPPSNSLSC